MHCLLSLPLSSRVNDKETNNCLQNSSFSLLDKSLGNGVDKEGCCRYNKVVNVLGTTSIRKVVVVTKLFLMFHRNKWRCVIHE